MICHAVSERTVLVCLPLSDIRIQDVGIAEDRIKRVGGIDRVDVGKEGVVRHVMADGRVVHDGRDPNGGKLRLSPDSGELEDSWGTESSSGKNDLFPRGDGVDSG